MKVLRAAVIRECDARAIAAGTPGSVLMERAGYGAYLFLTRVAAPGAERVLVLAGKGNNAGDAFVTAYYMMRSGRQVELCLLGAPEELSGDAEEKWTRLRALGPHHCYADSAAGVRNCVERWHGDVIVDGLLGTGLRGDVTPLYRAGIEAMNRHGAPVCALDIPSGLDADTGLPHGAAVRARWTVTFGHAKRGMLEPGAAEYCGRVEVVDIGLEREVEGNEVSMLSSGEVGELLPRRGWEAHKHECGHMLVVAGSRGMTGAAILCARAALASGAGLVTLAVPASLMSLVAPGCAACMTLPVPDEGKGVFTREGLGVLCEELSRFDAIALGPGLGRAAEVKEFLAGLLRAVRVPVVVDADGLNHLGEMRSLLESMRGRAFVLTPHPGEFTRIAGVAPGRNVHERVVAACEFAAKYGVTVVLKGYFSVIAGTGREVHINPTGNPGMATAGAGDVLTGVIGGLLAQGLGPYDAARVGAYLHGLAGDCAAGGKGWYAVTAEDIIQQIGKATLYVEAARLGTAA